MGVVLQAEDVCARFLGSVQGRQGQNFQNQRDPCTERNCSGSHTNVARKPTFIHPTKNVKKFSIDGLIFLQLIKKKHFTDIEKVNVE